MSIQFVVGPAGSGKSTYLQQEIIEQSLMYPGKKYLLIVPDQFNMQTQKELICKHPNLAFSNIEVLSFSRLSHRILEEVGGDNIPVLDDTGKNLIIRHIAEDIKDELSIMQDRLGRIGYISEVKSAISEFMQYGIKPDDLLGLIDQASDRKALTSKLKDLEVIYRSFMKYKADKFITREETLDIVKNSLHKSSLISNAIIVFDGFTGFTPIQERVIEELMIYADRIVFSFTVDEGLDPYTPGGEQDLFWLSRRAIYRLKKIADQASIIEDNIVYITRKDGSKSDLSHLERNIFRFPYSKYEQEVENIHLYKANNIRSEIIDTCQRIKCLTGFEGYKYQDIAIVSGDLGAYADDFEDIARSFDIPIYLDYSRSVLFSPFIEAIRAAFDVIIQDFSRESILRFLRTGFGKLDKDACDELENFLLRTGIRGYSSYCKVWTVNPSSKYEESDAQLTERLELSKRLNEYREVILDLFDGLHKLSKAKENEVTITEFARELYGLLSKCGMYKRLISYSEEFEQKGNREKASEYKQVYPLVIKLLDQVVALIGEEYSSIKEFKEIIEAGFSEIKLGVIPQEIDVVTVGDITRSRLKNTKIIFFLGVNDSNIPGGISSGGIISDLDREFICSNTELELAPTPREQIFTQRLYLYMNMTKPSEGLYISFVQMSAEGKGIQPSYLIAELCKLYKNLKIEDSASTHSVDKRLMPADISLIQMEFAALIREYAAGNLEQSEIDYVNLLDAKLCKNGQGKICADIYDAGFSHMSDNPLAAEIAQKLYKETIDASISRLEKYASCAYAHFLSYGLKLKPRSEFGFERRDMGDIFHTVLEIFANTLSEQNISWGEYTEEFSHKLVDDILDDLTKTYGETVLLSSARTQAISGRLSRICKRTVDGIKYQIKQGKFEPSFFEYSFRDTISFESDGTPNQLRIVGKIDRIDICESEGKKYLRIVDYKSGNKDFDINALYYGLSLQLSVYMLEALKHIRDSKAAGMLYYHIADPMISDEQDVSDEQLESAIQKELMMKGIVVDDPEVLAFHDAKMESHSSISSDIIPVGYKKDGSIKSGSSAISAESLELVLEYAKDELCKLAEGIMAGDIKPVPHSLDEKKLPCSYCEYSGICPIKSGIPGYEACIYPKYSDAEVYELIKNSMDQTK